MKTRILYFFLFFALNLNTNLTAQTASVTKGCLPLEVDFNAPLALNYYWDFDDGASSDTQSPSHIFTNPGNYNVILYNEQGGSQIGQIEIKVYADPVIQISSDISGGCSPLTVQFSSSISMDSEISIEGYLWAFGDGSSSTLPNPVHTYSNAGDFDISLQLTTSILECDQTQLIEDFIKVDGVFGNFLLNETSACEAPATFDIINTVQNSLDNTYQWDFGNGQTSTQYAPGSITYLEDGIYTITLTIENPEGCVTNAIRQVTIGPPPFDLNIPDSVCIFSPVWLRNNTITENFEWTFGGDVLSPTEDSLRAKEPIIYYLTDGWKTLTLRAWTTEDCVSDTTFSIYVQDPDPTFAVDPIIACDNPMTVTLDANDDSFATYLWTYDPHQEPPVTQSGGSTYTFEFTGPDRDTTYFNQPDTIPLFVEITTALGCWDTISNFFVQRRPEAFFLPDVAKGCAPLTINFEDATQSHLPVNYWKWSFGTGDEQESTSGGDTQYIYEESGEYYVQLIIENEVGCRDTSYGIWIHVGEPITSDYTIDKTEICLKDSISLSFTNLDERIDAWHFDSDDGRFVDCWTNPDATHVFFDEPGTYPLIMEIEYNGCMRTIIEEDKIIVNGAKADIDYMLTCENPFDVMLSHQSHNATELTWNIANQNTSNEDALTYTFDSTGNYMIYLEVENPASGCPADVDSVEVFIRDIQAGFTLPERVCDNQEYVLDASASVDVDIDDCYDGFLWILPSNRPREVGTSTIDRIFFPESGHNDVTLVVKDINGCTDTVSHSTTSYGIDPAFVSNFIDAICVPQEGVFQDLSAGDTTLVGWQWSFGETIPNPIYNFTLTDTIMIDTFAYVPIIFYVEDVLGCIDSTGLILDYYDPVSNFDVLPDTTLCAGDSLFFFASDYNEQGSFLNFTWDFGEAGIYSEQNPIVPFPEIGEYPLVFTYEEDLSGCNRSIDSITVTVIDTPIAAFATDADTLEALCHPTTISFENMSIYEGQVFYGWNFGNGAFSAEEAPVITYDKGTYEATLYVQSVYGCFSSFSDTFTLIGPEGTATVSDTSICLGETVTFTLQDTADIASYTWDFGDGETIENQNPASHTYEDFLAGERIPATLILQSTETDCELIEAIPISVADVEADFTLIDSLGYCGGSAFFENLSVGADSYTWDFGDGTTSLEEAPVHIYETIDSYTVTLEAFDADSGCSDFYENTISLQDAVAFYKMPNIFSPNNDGTNDYFKVAIREGFEDLLEIETFKIYNRWGNLVYDNDNPEEGWNGRHQEKLAPPEVYVYYIEVEIRDCKNETIKGNVTLIR